MILSSSIAFRLCCSALFASLRFEKASFNWMVMVRDGAPGRQAEGRTDFSGTDRWKGGNLGAVSKSGRIAVLLGALAALGVLVPLRGSAQPAASEKVAGRGAAKSS